MEVPGPAADANDPQLHRAWHHHQKKIDKTPADIAITTVEFRTIPGQNPGFPGQIEESPEKGHSQVVVEASACRLRTGKPSYRKQVEKPVEKVLSQIVIEAKTERP